MNRPIKFRAYFLYEPEKAVHDLPYAEWSASKSNCDLAYVMESSDYAVMQYTGLHDKNGVEIYEGDILQGKVRQVDIDEPLITHALAVVTWFDAEFILVDADEWVSGANDEPAYIIDDSQGWVALEVIGNIWENPELLTKEGDQ